MKKTTRRTQQERREATIAKLLEATIACLVDFGYRDTSIGRICERSGVSHGGLFRHFPSRTALLGAATDEIVRRHLKELRSSLVGDSLPDDQFVEAMIRLFRSSAQSPLTSAWREIIIAARTNSELCAAINSAVHTFEDAIMDLATNFVDDEDAAKHFGTLILSILHMYDSEASTVVVFQTKYIEDIRDEWAAKQIMDFLESQRAV